MTLKKRFLCLLVVFVIPLQRGVAQCAMCKAVIESGDKGLAEGINDGIVYLMIFPYVLVAVLAYVLYRYKFSSKKPDTDKSQN